MSTTAIIAVIVVALAGGAYFFGRVRTRKRAHKENLGKKVRQAYEVEKQANKVAAAAREHHKEAVERRKEVQDAAKKEREGAAAVPDADVGDALDAELGK